MKRIDGLTVGDVMRRLEEHVDGDVTVERLVELHQVGPELLPVAVRVDDRIRGVVGQSAIVSLSHLERTMSKVVDVMTPIGPRDVVSADETLEDFLARPAAPAGVVLVVADERVVGVVTGREMAPVFTG